VSGLGFSDVIDGIAFDRVTVAFAFALGSALLMAVIVTAAVNGRTAGAV